MRRDTLGWSPPGMYAWDLWLIRARGRWHLYHLQAPEHLPPWLRHEHATVGHAVSRDLVHWESRGTVLQPGPPGSWDDRCLWTGCVIPWSGGWAMFYTGRRRGELLVQRIGVAFSDDLHHFEKSRHNPVLTADPRWYQTAETAGLGLEDWRDPWVYLEPGQAVALVTARTPPPPGTSRLRLLFQATREALAHFVSPARAARLQGRSRLAGRGCLARATTTDLVHWTVHPPLLAPGRYDALECPQYLERDGWRYLFFSTMVGWYTADWGKRTGPATNGLHAFSAPLGSEEWRPAGGTGIVPSRGYAGRLVHHPDGVLSVGWQMLSGTGRLGCWGVLPPQRLRLRGGRVEG